MPRTTRRGTAHGSGPGCTCWVVERTFAWPDQFERLRIRPAVRADLPPGLPQPACALICYCELSTAWWNES